jgi:hypothetical protein
VRREATRGLQARDIIALLSSVDIFLEGDLERALRSRMSYSKLQICVLASSRLRVEIFAGSPVYRWRGDAERGGRIAKRVLIGFGCCDR